MNNEEKIRLYSCIKRQFTDPGLYKSSRIYEWLFTNGFSLERLGYNSFEELCADFPEVFMFQEDRNSEFVLIKDWQTGDNNISDRYYKIHPADNFFGTRNIILNDDIIEMTQQSLYALTKILGCGLTVQQMKQEVFQKFEESKLSNRLEFLGEKYVFPIDYCQDGQLVNGIVTKNLNSYGKSLYFSFEKTRIFRAVPGAPERKIIPAEIPEEEKRYVFNLLRSNFPLDQQVHMAAVSKFLTDHDVDRMEFGYYKMKDFLAQMPFLEMKEIILGGVPQIMVTIKDPDPENKLVYSSAKKPFFSSERTYQKAADLSGYMKNSAGKIPVGKLTDFCNLPIKPLSILEKFIDQSGETTDFYDLPAVLAEDFDNARRNGAIRIYNGKLTFPCRFQKSDGSNVELTLKPSTYEGKEWFLYYVDTLVHESKAQAINTNPAKLLESISSSENLQFNLNELASMSVDEEWDFKNTADKSILNSYLNLTFGRLMHEKKICISPNKQFAAFNTGLVDSRYDYIYACLIRDDSKDAQWIFAGFCTEFSNELGNRLVDNFVALPQPPAYFTRKEDLFFDFKKYLHIDFERLFMDNIQCFPSGFLIEHFFDNQQAREIVEQIQVENDSIERDSLYEQLKELVSSNTRLLIRVQNRLKCAVELAKKRVKWNYKTAIPAYFPKRDAISLMLPLALEDEIKPDAALVVELTRSGSYQAQAILTLSQAYINARLVCKLSEDWLKAALYIL